MNRPVSKRLSDPEKVRALEETVASLNDTVQSLEHQLDWFKRQLFGRKSEKRLLEDNPHQPLLNGFAPDLADPSTPVPTETITYTRAKQRGGDCVTDSGLRFDDCASMTRYRRKRYNARCPSSKVRRLTTTRSSARSAPIG
jgi:hypothetical protein